MATFKQFTFDVPTTNTDGSAVNLPLTYNVLVDTVNPPIKSYAVPSADVAVAGLLTVTFASLGFAPVNGTTYFAAATATDTSGTSPLSNIVTFTYTVTPSAPTNFLVG